MILALNMSDEAEKENIFIDEKSYQIILKTLHKSKCCKKHGIYKLLDEIINTYSNTQQPFVQFFSNTNPTQDEVLNQKFNFVKNNKGLCEHKRTKIQTKTEKIDSILMHKFLVFQFFYF